MTDSGLAFWRQRAAEYAAAPNPPTLAVVFLALADERDRLAAEVAELRERIVAAEAGGEDGDDS